MCLVAKCVLLIGDLAGLSVALDGEIACLATGLGMEPLQVDDPNGVGVTHCVPVLDELNIARSVPRGTNCGQSANCHILISLKPFNTLS